MKKMNKKNINYTDLPKFDKKYPKNRRETPNLNMPLCKPELASLYA